MRTIGNQQIPRRGECHESLLDIFTKKNSLHYAAAYDQRIYHDRHVGLF